MSGRYGCQVSLRVIDRANLLDLLMRGVCFIRSGDSILVSRDPEVLMQPNASFC